MTVPVTYIRQLLLAATMLAALLVFGLCAAPAMAKVTHASEGAFTGEDAPGGPFELPLNADAVDQSDGNVYVLEATFGPFGHNVIDKFDGSGVYAGVHLSGAETPQGSFAFLPALSGIAVDNSLSLNSGDVYLADSEHGVVDRFDKEGKFLCQITAKVPGTAEEIADECAGASGSETPDGSFLPAGLAVDASGNLYVADDAHAVIDRFSPSGAFLGQIKDEVHLTGEMASIALDSAGDLFVTNFSLNVVKFDSSGSFISVIDSAASEGVAVDRGSTPNHVFVSGLSARIAEYDEAGTPIDEFGSEVVQSLIPGLAVDDSSGKIYVTEFSGQVKVFGPDVVIPDITVGAATEVHETSTTLHGHVDPDAANGGGEVLECSFEYVTDAEFNAHPSNRYEGATSAPCSPATPYASPTDVTATVAVAPSTAYHFRLVAANASKVDGEAEGPSFTTLGPPAIDSESASGFAHSAKLTAAINPFGSDTSCQAQYVNQASFEASGYAKAITLPCVPADLGSGVGDQTATVTISGLQIGSSYHYRFVATNGSGSTTGEDKTFLTFGIESFTFEVLDKEGHAFTQAGGHPYALKASFMLNGAADETTTANVKDVITQLPRGMIGNPAAAATCTREQLTSFQCSGASQVGRIDLFTSNGAIRNVPLYNLVPPPGVPAELGARFNTFSNTYIDANVKTGGGYNIVATASNVTAAVGIIGTSVELWGVPADASHDELRRCPPAPGEQEERGPCSANAPLRPFLTAPTSCTQSQPASISIDAWQAPGEFLDASSPALAFENCQSLVSTFAPSLSVKPDTGAADSPSGLGVDLDVPLNEGASGLATPTIKSTTVALPAGISVNPSGANGLEACSQAEIGLDNANQPTCPSASKIGSVEVKTPLLPDIAKGAVYVAEQAHNPFNSLLAIYLTVSANGALVKLAGHVVADPVTGQLTTTFDDLPPLPFEALTVRLFGGANAALATPESCGTFAASATVSPWSGTAPVDLSSPFAISSSCVSGFAPSFAAGTSNPLAGRYSPLAVSFSRSDTDQQLSDATVTLPPGMLAKIAGVSLCSDADANAGTCPASSQIGTVQTGAGVGPNPLFLPGKFYLTGPYKGAPYGESVVVPAIAGPFNLGTVVVRGAIHIDPTTAQATVVSDPFPTILEGIPTRIRRVDVIADRPAFAFNPTSCQPSQAVGTLLSTGGASSTLSSPFQVGGCGELAFKPRFSASAHGPGSKANGTSLDVKVSSGQGPQETTAGQEANIAKVDVQLPAALPSRLTTLQKACTDGQFAANPAGCPTASLVGSAAARTPALPDPLTGPAYFVSHGGQAFPDLVIVLQGDGVTIQLTGHTQIKNGITFSHFDTVPDAPVSSFELKLPEGKYSVLAAPRNLCATTKTVTRRRRVTRRVNGHLRHVLRTVKQRVSAPLLMPTTITAQSGAVLKQTTKITVTGCRKTPKASKVRKARKSRNHSSRR